MSQEDIYNEWNQSQGVLHGASRPVWASSQKPPRCANCDIDILWSPTVLQGKTYCCSGCAAGGPCCCDYSLYSSVNISGIIHYGPDEETLRKSEDLETS